MTDLIEARAKLLAQFPPMDDLELEEEGGGYTGSVTRAWDSYLHFSVHEIAGIAHLHVVAEIPGNSFTKHSTLDDQILRSALVACAHQIATIHESDEWDCGGDGYADSHFTGTETWEDQAGMEVLKKNLQIPVHWYLMKIVNFNHEKLMEMEQWLRDNCEHEYKRVGWTSSCTTKVGVAFANMNEAFFFKMRWR